MLTFDQRMKLHKWDKRKLRLIELRAFAKIGRMFSYSDRITQILKNLGYHIEDHFLSKYSLKCYIIKLDLNKYTKNLLTNKE